MTENENKNELENENENKDLVENISANPITSHVSGFWSEKVYVVTDDYEINGYVFMPKTAKKNRVLSDILNSKKRFVAIKAAEIINKKNPERKIELHSFIHINLNSIILIRPNIAD